MAASSLLQLGPGVIGAVQWVLVGIELLVLAYVVMWLARHSRVRRLVRPFWRRAAVGGESAVEVGRSRPARLVSMGGGSSHAERAEPDRPVGPPRALRPLRLTRTPPRPMEAVGSAAAVRPPATLHCPGCGSLLARGELATRLVTRCTGCGRRIAVRLDGDRVVVTLEG
jgi:hypothetical protein